jgi:condensin complex subunit 3
MKTRDEAEKNKLQFICGELLRLCLILDYSADEAGRRNLRDILKQLLVRYDLDENAGLIFDVMDKISDLKEFINEVFGLIREWLKIPNEFENDAEDAAVLNEMQNLSLNPTEQFVISIKAMACVTLLLERTEFDLNDYEVFCSTFLTKQVLPSLHSPEPALQLTALMCMIQFCLMNKDLAVDNIDFFLTTLAGECSEEIGAVSIRALFDILLKFGFNQFDDDTKRKIRDLFFNILLDGEDESVRVVVVEGCAKLMLFSQFKDDDIMQRMIELYYDSDNQDSYESSSDTLKQCLSFFFPIYCHTNEENQYFMARVCFKLFFDIGSLPVVEDGTITAQQVQLQMIEWIHPFNIRE